MTETEHLLVCLAEEASEIIHSVSKALRFGLNDGYPGTNRTNAQDIQKELSDLQIVAMMLVNSHKIPFWGIVDGQIKKAKVHEYMEYAKQKGTLRENKP